MQRSYKWKDIPPDIYSCLPNLKKKMIAHLKLNDLIKLRQS